MLREVKHAAKVPPSIIFRNSLFSSTVPTAWKEGIIVPIFKKGCRSDPCNNKPVNFTSVVRKALQSIIHDKRVAHFINNNLI